MIRQEALRALCITDPRDLRERFEPVSTRFFLAEVLDKMRPGQSLALPEAVVLFAWPPTGDYDRSDRTLFRALAGGRPEISYTTDERIKNDLADDNYTYWTKNPLVGDYVFHRPVRDCKRCEGSGYYREFVRPSTREVSFPLSGTLVAEEEVASRMVECDHA